MGVEPTKSSEPKSDGFSSLPTKAYFVTPQGFEPRLTDPKSVVLPLDDPPLGRHFRCRGPDLNWGHQHFQCCALPTELSRQKGRPGGRPLTERAMRFELTTFSLARRHSTAELRPLTHDCCLGLRWPDACVIGGPGRIRTDDLLLAKETPSR